MSYSAAINRLHHSGGEFSEMINQHTASPSGIIDYVIVAISVLILIGVVVLCIKFFLKPGETEKDHIKRIVLDDEYFIEKRKHHE